MGDVKETIGGVEMALMKYWLWLSGKARISAQKKAALLNHFGTVENLYYAENKSYLETEGITPEDIRLLSDKSFDRAERIMEDCEKSGIKVVTIQDAEYPDRLKNIFAPPVVLYYRGTFPVFDEEAAIAIVGTRSGTAYGRIVTERLGYDISRAGGYVVSGMARGLDACAHMGALKAGKPTAAVLGSGPDIVYPAENRELYEDIVAAGCVLSEYPPKTRVDGRNFPSRNRIISGLCLCVVVTEAGSKSGTLITADHALEQGRDVFAVPGNIDSPGSAGTNALIKEGAKLITSAEDVIAEYAPHFPRKLSFGGSRASFVKMGDKRVQLDVGKGPKARRGVQQSVEKAVAKPEKDRIKQKKTWEEAIKGFTGEQQEIILSLRDRPMHADEIIERHGSNAGDMMSMLSMLEIEGVIKQLPGKRFFVNDGFLDIAE